MKALKLAREALKLDIFDLFNPREHPRDGNGQFASKWSQKAVGSGVQRHIEAKLSPQSQDFMGKVHNAAQGRRDTNRRMFMEMQRDPNAENPATLRAIADCNLANAQMHDLLGRSLAQSRASDLSDPPGLPLLSVSRPGTPEDLQLYMGELSNAMGALRRSLGAMPNKWEVDGGKPGAMAVVVGDPHRPGPADIAADITDRMQDSYAYAVQLTGFQVEDFKLSWQGREATISGSHYDPEERQIGLSPRVASNSGTEREFLHEFAHLADDDNPERGRAQDAWLKARSHDGTLKELKGPGHVGYQDAFVDPYVGRVYPTAIKYDPNDPDADLTAILGIDLDTELEKIDNRGVGTTELMSVGLEYFATSGGMAKLYSVDPDHFNFVVEQILNAKRRPGARKDSIPDLFNPLASILSRIINKVDPAAIAPDWSEADILSEGRAVVGFLVEGYRAVTHHRDAAPPMLPQEDAIASYFAQVLNQIEPSLDLEDWSTYDIIGEAEAALDVLINLHHERSLVDILSQPLVAAVPQGEAGYLEEYWNPAVVCARCFAYIPGGACEVVQGDIKPTGGCSLWESMVEAVSRTDDNQAVQKVLDWHGLKLGIQYLPGDRRHERTLTAAYGHVRGTYGQSDDGMALDVWVNLKGAASDRCFKLQQLTQDGEHDEDKYILGVESIKAAQNLYTANMPKKLMGTVKECAITELKPRADATDSDRADGFFNWKEASHSRDENGRFAEKPSAKNQINYSGNAPLITKTKELAQEIASVHTLPPPGIVAPELAIANVEIESTPHPLNPGMGGQYSPQYQNRIELWTPGNNFVKGNTFDHEYGHHVDSVLSMNKGVRPFSFASFQTHYAAEYLEMFGDEVDPEIRKYLEEDVGMASLPPSSDAYFKEMAEYNPEMSRQSQFGQDARNAVGLIMHRARNSTELTHLRDIATQGYIDRPDGVRKEVDRKYVEYLLNPTEVFARSYSQWIATRGLSDTSGPDNPKAFQAHGETMVLGSRVYPTTWGSDSFRDIHNVLEDGFSELGLLQGKVKYK